MKKLIYLLIVMVHMVSCDNRPDLPPVKHNMSVRKICIDTDGYYHLTVICNGQVYTIPNIRDYDVRLTYSHDYISKPRYKDGETYSEAFWTYYLTQSTIDKAVYIDD